MATTPDVIKVAHSPDADDAFMFWALAHDKVDTEGLKFEQTLTDIETLNKEALKGTYELTAISYYGYAKVRDKYAILNVGSSIGDKYGPVVIAKEKLTPQQLENQVVAVPGDGTSAYLALKLWNSKVLTKVVPFDEILERVESGEFIAGVIIHEGQLYYGERGLKKIVDLGEWWFETTNLPLPLGGNAIRKDLGPDLIQKIGRVLYRSIEHGLNNREEALDYAMGFARDLPREKADKFVGMYVNDMTLNADTEIRKAVRLFLYMGAGMGLVDEKFDPEFIDVQLPANV